jgi:hypothetical protein
LTTNTQFLFSTTGAIYPEGQKVIDTIAVGYQESRYYVDVYSITGSIPLFKPEMLPASANSIEFINPQALPTYGPIIKWSNEGDYYPIVKVIFNNGTISQLVIPNGKVHVYPYDSSKDVGAVLQQQHDNNRDIAITVDGIVIGILIAIVPVSGWLYKRNPKQDNTADNQYTQPDY